MKQCINCESITTPFNKNGSAMWYKHNDGYICVKCYHILKWNPTNNPINNAKRILFKGKRILLKEKPRTGICSWCNKKGLTDIHHIEYHDNNPLKDTIELCKSCHAKESLKTRYNINGYRE